MSRKIDNLVLGTVNAPWRRQIDAATLAALIVAGDIDTWLPHLTTFFTEVRAELALAFADQHSIPRADLCATYDAIRLKTGETSPALEALF